MSNNSNAERNSNSFISSDAYGHGPINFKRREKYLIKRLIKELKGKKGFFKLIHKSEKNSIGMSFSYVLRIVDRLRL